jgi:hypothetical protein
MISEEPDEDADTLDDDNVLETYLGSEASKSGSGLASVSSMPDWPPSREAGLGLDLDAETFTWFKSNHADWRLEMVSVLRSWMTARLRGRQTPNPG